MIRWSTREPPLPPVAVAGTGAAAVALRAKAKNTDLRAAGNDDWIVLLGDAADLPWADGAVYLGWDAGLLVPTTRTLWPPADLVHAAIRQNAGDGLAVLLPGRLLLSPVPARHLDPSKLS